MNTKRGKKINVFSVHFRLGASQAFVISLVVVSVGKRKNLVFSVFSSFCIDLQLRRRVRAGIVLLKYLDVLHWYSRKGLGFVILGLELGLGEKWSSAHVTSAASIPTWDLSSIVRDF